MSRASLCCCCVKDDDKIVLMDNRIFIFPCTLCCCWFILKEVTKYGRKKYCRINCKYGARYTVNVHLDKRKNNNKHFLIFIFFFFCRPRKGGLLNLHQRQILCFPFKIKINVFITRRYFFWVTWLMVVVILCGINYVVSQKILYVLNEKLYKFIHMTY